MEISEDGSGVVEFRLDQADVHAPTALLREFVVMSGDRDLNGGIQTGEFQHQLRQAVTADPR
ncbi:hypothetical protein QRB36_17560 [Mycobacterium marseillense]|uniref:hypothetical protein n=1 Tax=Mycobacterium marseillense TaxID=701042 RepID=UPI0025931CCF|nr:hypothetical protein [Mycobacterium marseillense]MDM3975977.1 hypothetical protein [Mycobacterium marseillense]